MVNLTWSAEGTAALLAAGGAEAVVGALRAHVGVEAVHVMGCRAAWYLGIGAELELRLAGA